MRARASVIGFLLACVSCAFGAKNPGDRAHWEYVVTAPEHGASVLRIEANFERAGTPKLAVDERARSLISDLRVTTSASSVPHDATKTDDGWSDAACVESCTIRYSIDLGALARACEDALNCGMRVDDTFVGPSLVWLVHPSPRGDASASLRVTSSTPFSIGMFPHKNDPRTFDFNSGNVDEGAFASFGPMRSRVLMAPGKNKTISLSIIGKHSLTDDQIATWITDAGTLVSSLTGELPIDHAAVFVVPQGGESGVTFGKVLSLTGASVGLVFGTETKPEMQHDEWVLVHEFFHLGFPSFRGEGRWLSEGMAVYYEPVLRTRFSWIKEEEMWGSFRHEMPAAQPPPGSTKGLVLRDDHEAAYWGGAMFALFADVKIREITHGGKTLDDVVSAILKMGGNATRVFTVSDVMKIGDHVTGTTVLSDLYAHHGLGAEPFDLDALFALLGVVPHDDGVFLRDDAPLASIRRAITARRR